MSEPMEVYRQACVALEYLQGCTYFYDYRNVIEAAPADVQKLLKQLCEHLYVPFYSPDMVWEDVIGVLEKAVSRRGFFERKLTSHKIF